MKNILKNSLVVAMIALLQFNALAAAAPTKFTTDAVQFGKSGSALNKDLIFDKGSGATNPRIRYNMTTNQTEFSNDGSTFRSIGSGGGGGGGVPINGNTNGDFEGGTNSWTSAGGGAFSIATVGANLLFDQRSGVYNASAGGQTLSNSLILIPGGLQGGNGAASCFFKTTASDYKLQVYDGATVLAERVIPALSVPTSISVAFVFPASGSVQIRIISQSNAADLAVDNCFLGQNALIDLSQATYVGGLTVSGCASFWGTTSTSPVLPATQTGCSYSVHGKITAPSTNVPGFTIANAAAGTYKIIYNGLMFNTSGSTASYFNMCSGSSSLCAGAGAPVPWGATDSSIASVNGLQVGVPIGEWSWTQASPTPSLELDMYLAAGVSNTAQVYGTTSFPGTFLVYYFPSTNQSAMTFGTVGQSWRGDVSGNTALTSVTNADFPGTPTVTEKYNRNFGAVTASALSNGITFTPAFDSDAEVCVSVSTVNTTIADVTMIMVMNGSQIDVETRTTAARAGAYVTFSKCVYAHLLSTAAQEFKIQGGSASGAQTISNAQWTVTMLNQQSPAPILVGGVLTPSAGVSQVVAAKINTGCTTTPCTILRQTGGVSSVTHNGTGDQTFNFVAGTFSSAPECTCADNDALGNNCSVQAESTSSVEVFSSSSANSPVNAAVTLMCIGPK